MFTRILRHAICRKAEAINGVMHVQRRAERRLFASSWLMLASRGGAQIIYSAAAGR
jgi:hypothetical protein